MAIHKNYHHQKINNKFRSPQVLSNKIKDKTAEGCLWIGGKNPCLVVLKNQQRTIEEVAVSVKNFDFIKNFLLENNLNNLSNKIRIVDDGFFDKTFSKDFVHQGFAARVSKYEDKTQFELLQYLNNITDKKLLPNILILDQVTDPQNVGAIVRSAVAFNFNFIVFTQFNAAKESAIMVKASAGNIEFAKIFIATNLNNLLIALKKIGYWCIGLDGNAKHNSKIIADYDNIALVVGSEGRGIRDLVKKNCDLLVKISTNQNVESLNVSVASAIVLNEIYQTKNL